MRARKSGCRSPIQTLVPIDAAGCELLFRLKHNSISTQFLIVQFHSFNVAEWLVILRIRPPSWPETLSLVQNLPTVVRLGLRMCLLTVAAI